MRINYFAKTFIVFLMVLGILSCNQSASKYARLMEERDSLKLENEIQTKNLNSIAEMIDTINSVLDSITLEEGMLFLAPTKEVKYAKSKTLRDLDRFEHVLRHQQRRIDELESLLSQNVINNQSGMRSLIANLKMELVKKDVQIAKLRKELSKKDVDITRLRKVVHDQKETISKQEETIVSQGDKISEQENVIARQDEMMNNAHILIATKKELSEMGITSKKRFLKESKLLNEKEFDERDFQTVDIRQCTELSFNAKNPKILTNMPKSSYVITKANKGEYLLSITNTTSFWSVSNYLVIQTD